MQSIDLQRVVGEGSSKKIALAARVTKRTRIYQPPVAASSEADAKGVCVTMSATPGALWARIDYDLLPNLLTIGDYIDSALGERFIPDLAVYTTGFIKERYCLIAEEPNRFLSRGSGEFQVFALK
jgi:hypothetical protein